MSQLADRRQDRLGIRAWRIAVLILLGCLFVIASYDLSARNRTVVEIKKLRDETAIIRASYVALQKDLADLAKFDLRLTQLETEVEKVKTQTVKTFHK